MNTSLAEIATLVNGVILGDPTTRIAGLSPIDDILAESLIFAEGKQNLVRAEASEAAAILVSKVVETSPKPLIQVSDPFQAFIQLIRFFYPAHKESPGIHPTALIDETAVIGKNVFIGPFVVVGPYSRVGDNAILKNHVSVGAYVTLGAHTTLYPHVTLYDQTIIGDNVTIHAGSVIGSDGFGYKHCEAGLVKIPHAGKVVIEDEVEIGAHTAIDRATLGETRIGFGTKIDNHVQIAHSVRLGKHNIICAFTGIAGSSISGDNVIFAANVGVSDHVKIDSNVILGARTGVPPKKHLKEGNIYLGNPARPKEKALEHELGLTRLPFIRKHLKQLDNRVSKLIEQLDIEIEKV